MNRVLGYYTDWTERPTPTQIDYRLFTYLCHAFAPIRPDGTLGGFPKAKSLCETAKAHQVKVLLSVGGADSNKPLTAITSEKATFTRFVDNLAKLVDGAGYAGIDVDWESHESAADRDRFTAFVVAVREKLGRERLLTMAVPASDWGGRWFDTATLTPVTDFYNVMTYDFHGPWSEKAGHNANLLPYPGDEEGTNFPAALAYWAGKKNVPREKLNFGIPSYGRGFPVRKWGEKWDKTRKNPQEELSWNAVESLLKLGWKRTFDTAARVPYLTSPRGDELISYEDFDSAQEKGAWIKKEKIGGIFFWEISQDFSGGTHMVVRGARRGFLPTG